MYGWKSHICNFFKHYFGHSEFVCFFFIIIWILDFLAENQQKLEKKVIYFTIQFHTKNLTRFTNFKSLDIEDHMLLKHSQKPFWQAFIANVCIFLYISISTHSTLSHSVYFTLPLALCYSLNFTKKL